MQIKFEFCFFVFFFSVVCSKQPVDPDVSGFQVEPSEDPQPFRKSHFNHGRSQRAQAPHLARTLQQSHQSHRSAQSG
jgi:hypothetical protein